MLTVIAFEKFRLQTVCIVIGTPVNMDLTGFTFREIGS